MPRSVNHVASKAKRTKILKLTKGYYGARKNVWHLGFHPYGFTSFEYDLTPYLKAGSDNVLAVRVNCTGGRPRWYAGAGIYRHTWLKVVNPVHINTYGIGITTPEVSDQIAQVRATTSVNQRVNIKIRQTI